jgi:O-antigen/teichoic acid export membrane protein
MVGRLLGTTALGFYAIAWDLLRFIPDRLYRIVGRVAFPTFATLQNNNAELAHGYRNFINYIARLILPIAGCAAVAAPELIASVFGKQYLPAGQALRLLSAGLALVGLRIGIGSVFYAKDHPSFDIYLNGCRFALLVVIVYVTSGFGLYSVSAGMSALEGVIAIAGQYLVCMLIGMRLKTLAGEVLPGLRSALLCMLATGIGKAAAVWLGIGPPLVLPFIVLPPAAVLLWLQAGDVTDMVARAFGRTRSEPA